MFLEHLQYLLFYVAETFCEKIDCWFSGSLNRFVSQFAKEVQNPALYSCVNVKIPFDKFLAFLADWSFNFLYESVFDFFTQFLKGVFPNSCQFLSVCFDEFYHCFQ